MRLGPAVNRAVVGAIAAAGLGLTALTAALGPAAADPVPPVDPLIPVPAPAPAPGDPAAPPPPADAPVAPQAAAVPQTLLGQFADVVKSNPLASMQQLLAASPQPAMIGMAPPPPGTPVSDPYTMAQFLKPQNFRMPTDDQVSPYAMAPNDNPSPFARIDAYKGVHAMMHSNLGRMPGADLGQPLPGTAPPPGTNIPAGLEQFYAPPEAAPAPATAPADPAAPPVDPLLLPAAAPLPPN